MISNKFKQTTSRLLLALIIISVFWACNDASTGFPVDNSYKRMFSPVTFQTGTITATSVEFQFSQIYQTSKYVIDISKQDSMKFDSIKKTVEYPFKPVIPASGATVIFIGNIVDNLLPATTYSARIKTVSADSNIPDSKYDYLVFTTKAQ